MTIDSFRRLILLVVLCMVQALVLNRVHLFNYAIPLFYVYFVLSFPRNYPKWALLLWCFAMGLVNDTFANTAGVGCASMTLIAVLQPYWLELFVPRDAAEDFKPSLFSMGYGKYIAYASPLLLLYCLVFFALEAFTFFNWIQWIIGSVSSAALTLVLILTIEHFKKRQKVDSLNK